MHANNKQGGEKERGRKRESKERVRKTENRKRQRVSDIWTK